jgi:opacity protein-like surface antigen
MRRFRAALLSGAVLMAFVPGLRAADVSVGGFGTYLDTKDYEEAWGGGLRLKYDLVEYIGLDFRGSMVRLQGLSANMFPVEANLILQLPIGNVLLPYGGMGVGYYFFDGGDLDLDNQVGYGPLAGVELRLSRAVALFGEARWLFLEPEVGGSGDLDKIRLDSFGVNAGIMFLF